MLQCVDTQNTVFYITAKDIINRNRTQNFRNIVDSSHSGSLQAFSVCTVSVVEFQSDATALDCKSLELDMHWHHSSLKHQLQYVTKSPHT